MLYRHVQPLFVSTAYTDRRVGGPTMRVRPLDAAAPDHLLSFVLWGAIQERVVTPAKADPGDPGDPDVVVVTAPGRPKLLIEMSADGEGWVVQSELPPRERPYLVTVAHMLPFIRVRLETDGVEARGYAAVLGNAPFELDGRSPLVGLPPDRAPKPGETGR